MKKTIISSSLALTVLFTSCATVMSGSKQNVKFESVCLQTKVDFS